MRPLTEAGQPGPATEVCAELLAPAPDAGHLQELADCLWLIAEIGWQTGRISDPARTFANRSRSPPGLVTASAWSTAWIPAGTCAATQRWAEAITLWAAHATHSTQIGMPDLPQFADRRQASIRKARQALGSAATAAAKERGAAMTLATAADNAALLAIPGPQQPEPPPGPRTAQPTGTGTGHLGRTGRHRRPDRRATVHQRQHRPPGPGPDPRQDRVPAPRRPDPARPAGRPRLADRPRGRAALASCR